MVKFTKMDTLFLDLQSVRIHQVNLNTFGQIHILMYSTYVVHGGWTDVEMWMPCKNGQMKGFRYCNNPEPANGGNDCEGDNAIIKPCNNTIEGKLTIQHVHCQEYRMG